MSRGFIYAVIGTLVVSGVVLGLGPTQRRFNELRSDQALIRGDTGDVIASATYQRFAARREAVSAMRTALVRVTTAESAFVADSGRPTTVFLGPYAFPNDPANIGPTVEIRRDRWVASIQNSRTSMTCTLTAMLDTVTGQYRSGTPVCGGWTPEESLAAVAVIDSQPSMPRPRVIDRVSHPEPVNNTPPRMPWVLEGVCPGPDCRFGQWTACSVIVVTRDKREGGPASFTLSRGDEFTALTGDLQVERPGLVRFRGTFTTPIEKRDANGDVVTIIRFSPADTLYPLVIADQESVWWFRGVADTGDDFWRPDPAVYRPDALKASVLVRSPLSTWWIRIRNARGQEGWAPYDPYKISMTTPADYAATCLTETG